MSTPKSKRTQAVDVVEDDDELLFHEDDQLTIKFHNLVIKRRSDESPEAARKRYDKLIGRFIDRTITYALDNIGFTVTWTIDDHKRLGTPEMTMEEWPDETELAATPLN